MEEASGARDTPPDLAEALLRVDEIGDRLDDPRRRAELVLGNPVLTREAGIEHAIRDVTRHLLRADQHALDLGIVDG